MRMLTKEVSIGNVKIGGKNPIAIQSMTNTKTEDVTATVCPDSGTGEGWLRHHPLCRTDHGSGKGSERH